MVKRKDVLTTNSVGANNNVGHLLRDLRPPGLLWERFTIQITEGKSPMCSVPWVLWLPGQLGKLKRDTDILEYSEGREMRNLETMIKKKRVERGLVKWWPAGPVRPSPATDTLCSVILVVKNFLNLSAFGKACTLASSTTSPLPISSCQSPLQRFATLLLSGRGTWKTLRKNKDIWSGHRELRRECELFKNI